MMSDLNEKAFDSVGRAAQAGARVSDPIFGKLTRKLTSGGNPESMDWAGDADWAQLQQEPMRARWLLRVAALVLVLLVVWASVAEIDEVTRGEARVVPSSQVQVIQSLDGGVVDEILVRVGQVVEAGDVLLRVDTTRFAANLGESRVSQAALRVRAMRLEALIENRPFDPPPELVREVPEIVAQERSLFNSRRAELSAQLSIAQSQLNQRQQELNEATARRSQAEQGLQLTQRELQATRPMVATGAVSEVEVLRLEREVTQLRGNMEQANAQMSRVRAAINEAQRRIEEVQLASRNQMGAELSETLGRLSALTEGDRALEDKVVKAEIRSPVRGTVNRLYTNTVGGVVQPGRDVVEIVPLDDALILEAQIAPRDIAFLRPGLEAMVKFSAYDFTIFGGLKADLESIGADTVVDERGNAFFIVQLRTRENSLGEGLPIIPGMVAQVDILTGKRTVLSYLLKPVLRAKANALSER